MVRFKVVKGSHLLLGAAVVLLIAVIAVIVLQIGFTDGEKRETASLETEIAWAAASREAKAVSAFASQTFVPESLQIEIIPDKTPDSSKESKMRVLIYHTHTHEAYEQNSEAPYEAIETWRTLDEEFSVVRVGSALADELTRLGCRVTHDTTDHEQDSLNSAYIRSLQTLESYTNRGECFDLYIDLHRDAFVDGLEPFIEHDGNQYAQIMLLVGRGDAYDEREKPQYERNLSFAQRLTAELNGDIPGICRNVTVKQGRYNQHMPGQGILIEVGHNLNTLQQALASVPCLARSLVSTAKRLN